MGLIFICIFYSNRNICFANTKECHCPPGRNRRRRRQLQIPGIRTLYTCLYHSSRPPVYRGCDVVMTTLPPATSCPSRSPPRRVECGRPLCRRNRRKTSHLPTFYSVSTKKYDLFSVVFVHRVSRAFNAPAHVTIIIYVYRVILLSNNALITSS